MDRVDRRTSRDITLAELLALHEEMLALTRSGVPLHMGLQAAAQELPAAMKQVANRVAQSLESGVPLDQTLHRLAGVPPFYCAVVQSGMRTGRLATALEGITEHLRRLHDIRTNLAISSIYPWFVLALSGILAAWILPPLYSQLAELQASNHPGAPADPVTQTLLALSPWLAWSWLVPVLVFIIGCGIWLGSRGVGAKPLRMGHSLATWLPGLGRARHLGQWGLFCDLCALLLEHQVAWKESVSLASEAVVPWRGGEGLRRLAEPAGPGTVSSQSMQRDKTIPSLIRLILSHGLSMDDTIRALRCTARDLHRRAEMHSEQVRQWAPILATIVIACTAVTAYALLVMAPWAWQLVQIVRED